jgi:hypothetical protein
MAGAAFLKSRITALLGGSQGKGKLPKHIILCLLVLLGLAMASSAPASATCPAPNTFANGQVADATQVMGNFNV